ncbi:MAG: NifB/NifX family molybdenum-iron cluster-binding protein [Planctomycetota bacterium]|jgi:predicted Fe-Mo cluster-binding NifX family protein
MKVAVTSTGATLEHHVGTRANRCGYLLIVDTDTMEYEAFQNPAVAVRGTAGSRMVAHLLLQEGVRAILAGGCGADLLRVLGSAGIPILVGMAGSVRRTIEQFKHSYCSVISKKDVVKQASGPERRTA